jgi:spore maturation protein CgeB
MFEAMACGIPIVSAPWEDVERLFTPATYLRAADGDEMKSALGMLLRDPDFSAAIADAARKLILERHTCRHRVLELLDIVSGMRHARHAPVPSLFEEAAS